MVSIKSVNVALNKRIRSWGLDRNILHNKYVLYFTVFITIINLVGTVSMGDLTTPLVFVLVGFLTTFFSKNMFVVLAVALVVANVLKYGANMGQSDSMYVAEGFEGEGAEGAAGAGAGAATAGEGEGESHEIVDTEQYLEKDNDKDTEKDGQKNGQKNGQNNGQKKESMVTKGTDKDSNIDSTSKKMESMANQYKKLEGLQTKILSGMNQVTTSLSDAEKIMNNMKKKV